MGADEVLSAFPLAWTASPRYRSARIKTAHFNPSSHRWLVLGPMLLLAVICRIAGQETFQNPSASESPAAPGLMAEASSDQNRWILTGLNTAAVICFVVWWRWMGRRRDALSRAPSSSMALAHFDPAAEAGWKSRALAAEARAEKATALLRAKLMPKMARWMMGEVVQRLLSHRSELVTSQQQAEREVAQLEERLEKIHAPLAERLQAYEKRIAELERELAARGEENRELIKARIASARKKLESERARETLVSGPSSFPSHRR